MFFSSLFPVLFTFLVLRRRIASFLFLLQHFYCYSISIERLSSYLLPLILECCFPFVLWTYWSGLPFPSPEDPPNPGIEPMSPALQADSLSYIQTSSPSTISSVGLIQLVSLSSDQPSVALENTTPPASSWLFGKITNSDRCDARCPFKPSGSWEAWDSPMKVERGESMWQVHLSPPLLSDQHFFVLLNYRAELLYQLGRWWQQKIANHWMHK